MFAFLKENKRKKFEARLRQGEVTLETVCGYLGEPVPQELRSMQTDPLPPLAASARLVMPGALWFVRLSPNSEKLASSLAMAQSRGLLAVVSPYQPVAADGKKLPWIKCEKPESVIAELSSFARDRMTAKVVAVTGSVGKTSAKEMMQLVASSTFETVYSRGNQNGFPQVSRYVQTLDDKTQVYIQEAGVSKPNRLDRGAMMLKPDAFVITNIGWNHVGYFGGKQEGILHEKLSLDRRATKDAVGFVNWDDPLLRAAEYQHRVYGFGVESEDADFRAVDVVERDAKVFFTVVEKETGVETPVVLNVVGKHNVLNALCAFAFGRWLGVERPAIVDALAKFKPVGVRQRLTELGGQKVYLDCYNASEGALNSVADTIGTIEVPEGAKRVFVIGDIDDKLGNRTEEIHRRVGVSLAEKGTADLLICFGPHAAWVAEEANKRGLEALATEDRAQMEAWVRERCAKEDLIAFKGGQQMELPRTLDNLFGTPFFLLDGDVTVLYATPAEVDGVKYRSLAGYGAVVQKCKAGMGVEEAVPPAEVLGEKLRVIAKSAYCACEIERAIIPDTVQAIDQAAFFRCRNLKEVQLPASLKYIGPSAFNSCVNLTEVVLPEGVATIDNRAFAFCPKLKRVVVPATVETIDEGAFFNTPNAVVVCAEGSMAHKFAQAHNMKVELV